MSITQVSRERAKELGMEIRSNAAGPKAVRVELEFKTEGEFKNFERVDLRISLGERSLLSAALREDRSKPGRVVVSFVTDRAELEKIVLWVVAGRAREMTGYELRVKDFVELEKVR